MVDALIAPDFAEDVDGCREFRKGRRWYKSLTLQVALASAAGILLGWMSPHDGVAMQRLGDTFIKLIKILVTPIAVLTIVTGVATVGDLKRVGRIGGQGLPARDLFLEHVRSRRSRPIDLGDEAEGDVMRFPRTARD